MVILGDRILGGILGLVVGDALGVPVQFWSREDVRKAPVLGMDRQAGHMSPGTWSDDSSLALSTAASLTAPNTILLTYPAGAEATDISISAEDPAIRNSTGGFVTPTSLAV